MSQITRDDYQQCKKYLRHYGSNYLLATKLFPREIAQTTTILYAFLRYTDEIVDSNTDPDNAADTLKAWEHAWLATCQGSANTHPILQATSRLTQHYQIPHSYIEAFFQSMRQDLIKTRYATYAELETYMYGSAAVVGLIMTRIIGSTDPQTDQHAIDLAYGMQLTNFLRDIREDYENRGRIYLPQDELEQFGISENHIAHQTQDMQFIAFMKFQIARTRSLFISGRTGIKFLKPEGRRAVAASAAIYEYILDDIETHHYDVFSARRGMPRWKKMTTALQYALGIKSSPYA